MAEPWTEQRIRRELEAFLPRHDAWPSYPQLRAAGRRELWEAITRHGVVYHNRATPRHFDVTIHLPDGLSHEQVRRIMRAAEACPVRRAIEAGMTFDEHLPQQRAAA